MMLKTNISTKQGLSGLSDLPIPPNSQSDLRSALRNGGSTPPLIAGPSAPTSALVVPGSTGSVEFARASMRAAAPQFHTAVGTTYRLCSDSWPFTPARRPEGAGSAPGAQTRSDTPEVGLQASLTTTDAAAAAAAAAGAQCDSR